MSRDREALPTKVRYIKNGPGGSWWNEARTKSQLHLGWKDIPADLIASRDLVEIEPILRSGFPDQGAATRDFNQLQTALVDPSQYIWVTVEDGYLWWTEVSNAITINPDGESLQRGHFWLTCKEHWRNTSLNHEKRLAVSDLPGGLTMTAAFRSTICRPKHEDSIRRTILNQQDNEAQKAANLRAAYEVALTGLIKRLSPKDFELLIDLILSRTGWVRSSRVGGSREGVDIDAENVAIDELAFVQVKSSANQSTLLDYIKKYQQRSENYDRMILAVHSVEGFLEVPETANKVHLWQVDDIAGHAVRLGLGSWIETRLA